MAKIDKYLKNYKNWKESKPKPIYKKNFASLNSSDWYLTVREESNPDIVITYAPFKLSDNEVNTYLPLEVARALYVVLKDLFEEE